MSEPTTEPVPAMVYLVIGGQEPHRSISWVTTDHDVAHTMGGEQNALVVGLGNVTDYEPPEARAIREEIHRRRQQEERDRQRPFEERGERREELAGALEELDAAEAEDDAGRPRARRDG